MIQDYVRRDSLMSTNSPVSPTPLEPTAPLVSPPKIVTLLGMEINLTALWELLTKPLTWFIDGLDWVWHKTIGKGRSRRYRRLSSDEQRLRRMQLLRLVAIGGLVAVIAGMLLFFILFAWYSRELPKPGEVVRKSGFSTRIFDRDGQLLYDLYNTERRVPTSIEQVPKHLQEATIAIEDRDFYKHQGFDILTILRIPYNIVFRQRVVGGSTLTQQLVKNALLTNERTVTRKFKELVLALQIERRFSKDEILEMYLNEAPYGGTAWGIGAASDLYFSKKVNELDLLESAFLAGLPQRPSVYSPFFGKTDSDGQPLWKGRTKAVLQKMKEQNFITDLAYQEALGQLDMLVFEKTVTDIKAPHFVFYVKDQLVEMFGEEVVENGGLQVTTTLDAELHQEAENIVKEEVDKIKSLNITNGAAMVMDPRNGEILSMVGSADYFAKPDEASGSAVIGGQFNVAVDGLRQPGSSIKPVTYLAMIQRGFTPASMLIDVPTTFMTGTDQTEKPYEPRNYDGTFRGPVSLRNSLGSSLNVPAVKSLATVGVDSFLQLAYDMGFPTLEPTQANMKRFGLSVTLGGGEVHLIDTVSAYSAFANGGKRIQPVSILEVKNSDGKQLYQYKHVEGRQVFTPEQAFLINDILSDNNARLLAFGANSLLNTGKPIAVKTGTTNDLKDNWTIGWSQEVMVGTWVGNNNNTAMKQVASGVTGASPIWRRIILSALEKGYAAPPWEVPSGVERVQVDSVSGFPSHDGFPEKSEYVIKGTLPSLPDPVHTKLKLCRGENKLANDARVSAGDYEEREFIVLREDDPVSRDGKNRWQEAINAWVGGQEDGRYKPPGEYCGESGDIFIELKRPENEKSYPQEEIEFEVRADSGEGIEKIDIVVKTPTEEKIWETINDREYKGKIELKKGRYEVWARATSRDGKQRDSSRAKIGTGGEDWKEPEPSPSPSPLPSVSPSPSASPL